MSRQSFPAPGVLLVTRQYFPALGGIETAVRQYARWYREMGFHVTILCCASKRTFHKKEEKIDGTRVVRSASLGDLFSLPVSFSFFTDFLRLARSSDIVHINLQFPLASLASLFLRKKPGRFFIVSWHSDVYRQKRLKHLTYPLDALLLKRADLILTSSPSLKDKSEVLAKMTRPVDILPYSINAKDPDLSAYPGRKPFHGKDFYLFFGRLVPYKGTEILEKAVRILMERKRNIRFLVFGRGPEACRFEKLAREFPDHVLFLHKELSQEEKYSLVASSKALLFPSVFPSEAFGITQLDAMVMGKAVINTELGTGTTWVAPDGECAITLEPGNAEMLTEALEACEAGLYDLEKLGNAGKKRVDKIFSEEIVEERFRKIIRNHIPGVLVP